MAALFCHCARHIRSTRRLHFIRTRIGRPRRLPAPDLRHHRRLPRRIARHRPVGCRHHHPVIQRAVFLQKEVRSFTHAIISDPVLWHARVPIGEVDLMDLLLEIGIEIITHDTGDRQQLTPLHGDRLPPIVLVVAKTGQRRDHREQQKDDHRSQLCLFIRKPVPDTFHLTLPFLPSASASILHPPCVRPPLSTMSSLATGPGDVGSLLHGQHVTDAAHGLQVLR